MTAARSSYASRLPMRHPVWIHLSGVSPFRDLDPQIGAATYAASRIEPGQAAALVGNFVAVLVCNQEILLRAR